MNPDDGAPSRSTGNAIVKLSDLRDRWGRVGSEVNAWKEAPQLIQVRAMDFLETWRLVAAHPIDPPKTVLLNKYELVSKEKVT